MKIKTVASILIAIITGGIILYPYDQLISLLIIILTVMIMAYLGLDEYPEMINYFLVFSVAYCFIGFILLTFVKTDMLERSVTMIVLGLSQYMNLRRYHYKLGINRDRIMPAIFMGIGLLICLDASWFILGSPVFIVGYLSATSTMKRYNVHKQAKFRLLKVGLLLLLITVFLINYWWWLV